MKKETKHLIGITAAGAAEGAALGSLYMIATAGTGPAIGAVVGGATAFTAERTRRAIVEKRAEPKTPKMQNQESSVPAATLGGESAVIDVTVETTSSTQRTDVAEDEAQPIVKSSVEQASNIPIADLSDTLAALHSRTRANAFPAWRTTVNEKTVASTNSASVYDHAPQRVS